MHPKKLQNVLAMTPQQRYDYFVRTVANTEQVWGLQSASGAWVVGHPNAGATAQPFWPEREFAEAAAVEDWHDAKAVAIPLEQFLEEWLPRLEQLAQTVGVFWHPVSLEGVDVDPTVLRKDLEAECAQYEE